MSDAARTAIDQGLRWLVANQRKDGAFRSYSAALTSERQWEEDEVNFVTALASMSLEGIRAPAVVGMRSRAGSYLRSQRERGDLWRYWSRASALHDYTPLDVDDTACCSLALGLDAGRTNARMLLANRDRRGRFYTWLLPRPDGRSRRLRWRLRGEGRPEALKRRQELWSNSEAEADDVDVVVNANVIRHLGPRFAPQEAVRWVVAVVEEGAEVESDHWYRSRTSLYRSVVAATRRGVTAFEALRDPIIGRLVHDPGPEALRGDLELADALGVLQDLSAPPEVVTWFRTRLLDRQLGDGSWSRSLCYYGGPQESFGWASEALTTAAAVGALSRSGPAR